MIKKIICPVDFNQASLNAIEYAAKLAQVFCIELVFVNVQTISPLGLRGPVSLINQKLENAEKRLEQICNETSTAFKVSTTYQVDLTENSLASELSAFKPNEALIIIGSNGSDNAYQDFFGSNTYQVIRQARCSVMMIPEDLTYGTIRKVIFAWDDKIEHEFNFDTLGELQSKYDLHLDFLQFSETADYPAHKTYVALQNEINRVLGKSPKVALERLQIPEDLDEFVTSLMIKREADILAMMHFQDKRNRLFSKAFFQRVCEANRFALLVMNA